MDMFKLLFGVALVLVSQFWMSNGELFTAITEVEPLLETHKRIIDDLDDYISKEEKRIAVLKKHLSLYKEEHDRAMLDIPNYLGNPINAFTLIKRLTTDLDHIEQSINIGTEYIKNITVSHDDVTYPTLEDLNGAAKALIRLQETYQLNVEDLSQGLLNGVQYSDSSNTTAKAESTPMSAGDCYELGRSLYNQEDFLHSLSWMMEARKRYLMEKELYLFNEADILEYISFSHFLMGDTESALEWTKILLSVDPGHVRAKGNIPHYEKAIKEKKENIRKNKRGETGERKEEDTLPMQKILKDKATYVDLCRGQVDIAGEVAKRLTCRYLTETHPFLKIAPIKMEYRYLQPDIVVFHQVITDQEIKHIQEMAKPRFKRAVVYDPKTGELVIAHYRISKSAWLKDSESAVVSRVSRRVEHMTGLSMPSAEELQVVNYGIGGHYESHFDFSRKSEKAFSDIGNRIATVLFYMSDVAQGGATVFTELGLSLFPEKNAAAFWMNLHPSGEGDFATRHAACPVLQGSKWVCNKWLHQSGQELVKPCNLEYQEEGFLRKVPRPVPKTSR